jgi:hypothetical protein
MEMLRSMHVYTEERDSDASGRRNSNATASTLRQQSSMGEESSSAMDGSFEDNQLRSQTTSQADFDDGVAAGAEQVGTDSRTSTAADAFEESLP